MCNIQAMFSLWPLYKNTRLRFKVLFYIINPFNCRGGESQGGFLQKTNRLVSPVKQV